MTTIHTDILVCGAGAAGLTLAIDLARRHVSFVLIDKAERPFTGSRGKGIQPRSLEIFEALGVADRMSAAGGHYPPQRKYRDDGGYDEVQAVEAAAPTPAEPYGQPLMLPQHLTESILRERLLELGHAPRYGHALAGFAQEDGGVTARIETADGELEVRARHLVGADGGRSFVRKALDIGFPGEAMHARAVVADLELGGLESDVWHRWNGGGMRQIGICPLRGTDLFQLQMPIPLEGEFDLSQAGLAAAIAERTGRDDIAVHAVHWASDYAMSSRLADRYRVGRVFIAGDAAHIHPPTGGQGLNTSVQDAWNLGWKLAAVLDGAPDALLDTYEAERREVAAGMLGLSGKLLDAAKAGDLRRGRETQQLDVGYPTSTLSLDERDDDAPIRAGYRAPDAPCVGAGGQPVRLFSLFKEGRWLLLRYEPAARQPAIEARRNLRIVNVGSSGAELTDPQGHLRSAYGFSPGDVCLIRPDGYIAAFTHDERSPALAAYIESKGMCPAQLTHQ
jgi:2-polyprenyl-6-methoxyphenol hydroxylase-like FAD-dependent oxidoreductase